MNFQTILTFANIIMMGAASVTFVYNKTDAAKFDPAPITERVAKVEVVNAVQDNKIETTSKDIAEIKGDVKELVKLLGGKTQAITGRVPVNQNAPRTN